MCSCLLQLTVTSRELSQVEKEITVVIKWAMSLNDNRFVFIFEWNQLSFCEFAQLATTDNFFPSWDKSRDSIVK